MVGFDPVGRAAVSALSVVTPEQLSPFLKVEVRPGRGRPAFVSRGADVGACPFEISQPPLLVVIERGPGILLVFPPVSYPLARPQLVSVLDEIALTAWAPTFAVPLIRIPIT